MLYIFLFIFNFNEDKILRKRLNSLKFPNNMAIILNKEEVNIINILEF
jgi:hypothetical protein